MTMPSANPVTAPTAIAAPMLMRASVGWAGSFGGPNVPQTDPRRNLAFRNLTRAKMVKPATGQQMATFLNGKGVNLTKLTKAQIRNGNNGADIDSLTQAQRDAFLKTRRSGSTSCARRRWAQAS
jgi:hypothetical protein